jgi:hypothetical protein
MLLLGLYGWVIVGDSSLEEHFSFVDQGFLQLGYISRKNASLLKPLVWHSRALSPTIHQLVIRRDGAPQIR